MVILGNGGLGVFSTLFQCSPLASCQPWQGGRPPLALVTLRNLLHKQKLTMVDVLKRAGMDRRKTTRADFIHIIEVVGRELKRNELAFIQNTTLPYFPACKPRVVSMAQVFQFSWSKWRSLKKGHFLLSYPQRIAPALKGKKEGKGAGKLDVA